MNKSIRVFLPIVFLIALSIIILNIYGGSDFDDCKKQAEKGDAAAQYNLALMYSDGEGVPQNYQEAVRWFRKASEQGDAKAQFNLGLMYVKGSGVTRDYKEAVKWYRKAAEQGVSKAQIKLALMYAKGDGVPQDLSMAHMFCDIAAANGYAKAEEFRDLLAKRMTPAQIVRGQKLAWEWMEKHP